MRFASHRDIARAVERGVRRAGLPIAYSAGFTPHPKISYAGAAPTGAASEAEYLELSLTSRRPPADVRDRLDAALPDGIDVIEVSEAPVPLAALPLEVSQWQVVLPGVRPAQAREAVEAFLALPSAEVERLTSKGARRVDARAAVIDIMTVRQTAEERDTGNAVLRMVVRHVIPAVRPDDVLAALRQAASLAPLAPPLVTRLAQGPLGVEAARARSDAAAWPPLRGQAHEQEDTTRPGRPAADKVGAGPAGAHNQFPRGAEEAGGPAGTSAPGSLTGDHPDARERAERDWAQRDRARRDGAPRQGAGQ